MPGTGGCGTCRLPISEGAVLGWVSIGIFECVSCFVAGRRRFISWSEYVYGGRRTVGDVVNSHSPSGAIDDSPGREPGVFFVAHIRAPVGGVRRNEFMC